jgi:hypothetical protein
MDAKYVMRGLVMYESLKRHCPNFHLYIFAYDELAERILNRLALPHVTVIPLRDIEDEALLLVKSQRSVQEYCWTGKPYVMLYVLEKFGVDFCTFIDADLDFHASPAVLLDELGKDSILITEHHYTPGRDMSATNGIYCSQLVSFRNDERGLLALRWWRNACLEWCSATPADGKFGDQKYFDDWPTRFEGVHVLQHRGGGVAPWNVQQYSMRREGSEVLALERRTGVQFKVIFYHFHFVRFYDDGTVDIGEYYLSPDVKELLYAPYLRALDEAAAKMTTIANEAGASEFDPRGIRPAPRGLSATIHSWKRQMRGRYNIIARSSSANAK